MAANGIPSVEATIWYLVPALPRSVGLGRVSSPPFLARTGALRTGSPRLPGRHQGTSLPQELTEVSSQPSEGHQPGGNADDASVLPGSPAQHVHLRATRILRLWARCTQC